MSEVHRYYIVKVLSEDGSRIAYNPHGPEVVLASDYDALAQRCRELETLLGEHRRCNHAAQAWTNNAELRAEVDRLKVEMEDLTFALADAERRAENAGRNASAFEDRMGDLQVENGKLRDEVARIRRHLYLLGGND